MCYILLFPNVFVVFVVHDTVALSQNLSGRTVYRANFDMLEIGCARQSRVEGSVL